MRRTHRIIHQGWNQLFNQELIMLQRIDHFVFVQLNVRSTYDFPLRKCAIDGFVFEKVRNAFLEPNVAPPWKRNMISEPLRYRIAGEK